MSEDTPLTDAERQSYQFLLAKRLEHFSQRRNYEWRSLFGFMTLLVATGAAILREPAATEISVRCGITMVMALAAVTVILFLFAVQSRDAAEKEVIRYLDRSLLTGKRITESPPEPDALKWPSSGELWAFVPQAIFVVLATAAFALVALR